MEWIKSVNGLAILVGLLIAKEVIGMTLKMTKTLKSDTKTHITPCTGLNEVKAEINTHRNKFDNHQKEEYQKNIIFEKQLGKINSQLSSLTTSIKYIETMLRNGNI